MAASLFDSAVLEVGYPGLVFGGGCEEDVAWVEVFMFDACAVHLRDGFGGCF